MLSLSSEGSVTCTRAYHHLYAVGSMTSIYIPDIPLKVPYLSHLALGKTYKLETSKFNQGYIMTFLLHFSLLSRVN
jgi:hypothetical protein